jgi:chromosome segregation ATPase
VKQHNQDVILSDSQDRLEKLQEWLHGEFVSELQTKTNELEQLKASSDSKVENLVHEVDKKNQEIVHLQNKIREITQHLKRGLREQILDELHLAELGADENGRKKKKQRKGLFARFSSKF